MLSRAEAALARFNVKPLYSLSPEHRTHERRLAQMTGAAAGSPCGWPTMRRIACDHAAFARQIRAADDAGGLRPGDLRAALSELAAGA